MTTHCKLGDTQAIVSYRFSNSTNKVIKIKNVPVDISVKEIQLPQGGQSVGVTYTAIGTGLSSATCSQLNATYGSLEFCDDSSYPTEFYDFNNRAWASVEGLIGPVAFLGERFVERDQFDRQSWWWDFNTGAEYKTYRMIHSSSKPPKFKMFIRQDGLTDDDNPNKTCELTIKYKGLIVFTVSGDCPCNYTVACGEECPEGYLKCHRTAYPGYCCIPCEPTKAEIRAMTQQVRRLNRG